MLWLFVILNDNIDELERTRLKGMHLGTSHQAQELVSWLLINEIIRMSAYII